MLAPKRNATKTETAQTVLLIGHRNNYTTKQLNRKEIRLIFYRLTVVKVLFCSLKKWFTPKIRMSCCVIVSNVLLLLFFNPLYAWMLSIWSQGETVSIATAAAPCIKQRLMFPSYIIVQELCESRGGHLGLSVLTSLLVSVDVKLYWTMLRHWSQLVPNMSTDIWGH